MSLRTIDLGTIGRAPTLHHLRREPGVRRAVAFADGTEVRGLCGARGPVGNVTRIDLGSTSPNAEVLRVGRYVVCVTCNDLDRRKRTARAHGGAQELVEVRS
jgi:hypothetical protein